MKKYIANIEMTMYDKNYSIVGETDMRKVDVLQMVKLYATNLKLECNLKTRKFFKEGKEVGSFEITSREF